jgi:predicted peptidase
MTIRFKAFLLGFCVALPGAAGAQASAFRYGTQTSKSGVTLPYRLFIPEGYDAAKAYPLVFALHGYGERGSDNEKQLTVHQLATLWTRDTIQARHPCFVLAPQCPADGDARWINVDFGKGYYSQDAVPISKYLAAALEILDSTAARYRIDADRVYIAGLSMGGYATWDVITRYPKRFAAAIPICGGGDSTKAPLIEALPIWAFHGDSDHTVPVEASRRMIAALKKAGGNPRYTEYPGVDHGSWGPALQEPGLPTWLFAQARPASVSLAPRPRGASQRAAGLRLPLPGAMGDVDGLGRRDPR